MSSAPQNGSSPRGSRSRLEHETRAKSALSRSRRRSKGLVDDECASWPGEQRGNEWSSLVKRKRGAADAKFLCSGGADHRGFSAARDDEGPGMQALASSGDVHSIALRQGDLGVSQCLLEN